MGGYVYNGFKVNANSFQDVFSILKGLKPEFEAYKKTLIQKHLTNLTVNNIDSYCLKKHNISNRYAFNDNEFDSILKILRNIDKIKFPSYLRCFLDDTINIYENYKYNSQEDKPITLAWQQLKTMIATEKTPYRVSEGIDLSMSIYLFEKDNVYYLALPVKDISMAKKILLNHNAIEEYGYNSNQDYGNDVDYENAKDCLEFWKTISKTSLSEGLEYQLTDNQVLFSDANILEKYIPSIQERAIRISKEITKIDIPKDTKPYNMFSAIVDYQNSDEYRNELQKNKDEIMKILPVVDGNNICHTYDVIMPI